MTAAEPHIPPLAGQTLARVWNLDDYAARSPEHDETVEFVTDVEEANVITSMALGPGDYHKVVIDLDLPAQLIPSTTDGHFHLIIDKRLTWSSYKILLSALRDAGLIEEGYYGASEQRGYSSVRLPWVRKPDLEKLAERDKLNPPSHDLMAPVPDPFD